MDKFDQSYYDENAEEAGAVREPIDIKPIADAGASVFNGPNGTEVCKTIRHALYIAGCVFGLHEVFDFIYRMSRAA